MSDKHSEAISLWDFSTTESPIHSPMQGDLQTEVAIVGGGFTGLSTALHLAEKGIPCEVLEAEKIGYGGSGRNVGLVNAGLWLPPQDVRSALGNDKGSEFVRILGEAPSYVFSLIDKYSIECEPTRTGTIHAAHSVKGFEDLSRRAEEWHRLGAPVDLLDQQQVSKLIGCEKFHGGLVDQRAGTINPMGYVRGLGRAALSAGARINTGVRVTALERQENKWRLQTTEGNVTAKMVILGTNAYTDDLWPKLKHSFTMIHYFQFATEPLGERAAHILPKRHGLWDTGQIMFSLRRDQFGRLIVGSMGRVVGGDRGLSKKWAQRQIRRLFPELGSPTFEKSWYGQIAMTPDHLPRIYRLDENLYTPIGYNGRGITPGTIFGRAMAGLISGDREEDLPLPVTALNTVSYTRALSRLYSAAFTANQLVKSL